MPVSYEKIKTFRVSGEDERNLREIMEAVGLNEAETLRFGLQVTRHLMTFAIENDPKSVFVEQQYKRGRVVFPEKMTHEELADAMIYVRQQIGEVRFDNLLKQGQNIRERHKRDREWFVQAKNTLIARKEAPYSFDEICTAIVQVSSCNLAYAKTVFEKHWQAHEMVQESIGKYNFLTQSSPIKEVVK